MTTYHFGPRSRLRYQLQQLLLALLTILMLIAVIALIVLAITLPAPLFGLMALVVLLLTAPVAMQLSVSPPVIVEADGILVQPLLWPERRIAWDQIDAIRPYGLLPSQDQEVLKRVLQGRNNYEAARGVMLLSPSLPLQYRIAGYFVGQPGHSLIAVTNRTHQDYNSFLEALAEHVPHLLKQKVDATN